MLENTRETLADNGRVKTGNRMECLAMLLAGGEGRRLAPLTSSMAKPAVPYGEQLRMIDFPLYNCLASGISTIGVLTHYCADSVHECVADRPVSAMLKAANGQVAMLPASRFGGAGYAGTADAIYRNLDFIERQQPEHVLIVSGDHIYQMDYSLMLEAHKQSEAEVTIAVRPVAWKEAHRFGIVETNEAQRLVAFQEKPDEPRSNLASMGIYLFRWPALRKWLMADAATSASSHDFGKDLLPAMLAAGDRMMAYSFEGYWRDVGTIDSLWEANMDLLTGEFSLDSGSWQLPDATEAWYDQPYVSPDAEVVASRLHPETAIAGTVKYTVVCEGGIVGAGSEVHESIVMPGVRIGRDVTIYRAIIGEGAVIEDGAVIGSLAGDVTVIAPGEAVTADGLAGKEEQQQLLLQLGNRIRLTDPLPLKRKSAAAS